MPGRRPKPGELHSLAGNPGKRRRPPALELEAHSGRVPRELEDAAARLVWERAIKPLCELRIVKRAHQAAAIIACQAIADALEIESRRVERERVAHDLIDHFAGVVAGLEGTSALDAACRAVERMAEAWARVEKATQVRAEARQWLSEFGLTPSSAAKLVAPSGGVEDPLADFLGETA